MVTLGIRLEPYVDYFNHVYQIIHNKKNFNIRNIFLLHLQSFFSEWTYGILARESGSLHVQSVVDKQCKYKIRSHCYSSNLGDYIKTQGFISTKLW